MIVAVIPAKGQSSRLPNKNLLRINNKSLLEYAVSYAKTSSRITQIYISTDSIELAQQGRLLGVDIIMRGQELGGDTPLIEVYKHALSYLKNDNITYIVGIQTDHPDRQICLDDALKYVLDNHIDNLITVNRHGVRNGALNILSMAAMQDSPNIHTYTLMDDCTNIHTLYDFHLAAYHLTNNNIVVVNKIIGPNMPTFIVAEAACNHMCDIKLAYKMIDQASNAGADAIKFQTYKAEKLTTKNATAFWGNEKISQIEYYKRLDRFGSEEYKKLFEYAKNKGIIAFSSTFDEGSTKMLADLGMPVFKIASCDITNIKHIKNVAIYKRPIMLSTGASTFDEIKAAIMACFEMGNYQVILLACTLSYPTPNVDANLRKIQSLIEYFPNIIIGLSDHTEPDQHMVIPAIAIALGAKVIEKHYTLDRSMTGSGHFFAANPKDLKKMVDNIRLTEVILGSGKFGVTASEQKAHISARRSIVAEVGISKNTIITLEMLGFKRPGTGLPPNKVDDIIGKKAKRDIQPDEQIYLEMVE